MSVMEDYYYENVSAVFEDPALSFDRRIRQLSAIYCELKGHPSFVVRVPSGEGFDRYYFSDGKVFRNCFDALEHQHVMLELLGQKEF